MQKCMKLCVSMQKYAKVFKSMQQYEKVWKSMKNNDKVYKPTYVESIREYDWKGVQVFYGKLNFESQFKLIFGRMR